MNRFIKSLYYPFSVRSEDCEANVDPMEVQDVENLQLNVPESDGEDNCKIPIESLYIERGLPAFVMNNRNPKNDSLPVMLEELNDLPSLSKSNERSSVTTQIKENRKKEKKPSQVINDLSDANRTTEYKKSVKSVISYPKFFNGVKLPQAESHYFANNTVEESVCHGNEMVTSDESNNKIDENEIGGSELQSFSEDTDNDSTSIESKYVVSDYFGFQNLTGKFNGAELKCCPSITRRPIHELYNAFKSGNEHLSPQKSYFQNEIRVKTKIPKVPGHAFEYVNLPSTSELYEDS